MIIPPVNEPLVILKPKRSNGTTSLISAFCVSLVMVNVPDGIISSMVSVGLFRKSKVPAPLVILRKSANTLN